MLESKAGKYRRLFIKQLDDIDSILERKELSTFTYDRLIEQRFELCRKYKALMLGDSILAIGPY